MRNGLLLLISLFLLSSCGDKQMQTFTANAPLYLPYDELRASFMVSQAEDMVRPGKIYFMEPYMYINEYQKGIHVVDLSDQTQPRLSAFISIPGNVDMAIRNNVLYADSYVDLVLVDISNPTQPSLIKRVEDIFEYVIPPYDYDYPLAEIDRELGVITGYDIRQITQEIHSRPNPWPVYWEYSMDAMISSSVPSKGGGNTYGVGGSMARFLTHENFLYALENTYKLKCFDLSNQDEPILQSEQELWGNVETLFISGDFMYVGTSGGMHILSLEEPSKPSLLSTYRHITACDPVVVEGDFAYVTLRSGNTCGGNQNLLEVIDIADKYKPERLASYSMTEPYGLGIRDQTLFICEGAFGLKVYDASNPYEIKGNELVEFTDIHAYDVIPLPSVLLTIGLDGFYLYDYSDLSDIRLLGSLPVEGIETD